MKPDTDTTLTDELAADIRAVDGEHKLGAAELATELTALGYTKREPVPAAPLEPQEQPEVSESGAILTWKGTQYVRVEERPVTLKDFKAGEYVMVTDRWHNEVEGQIHSIDIAGIHVNTDRGPITIQSTDKIRKA